MGRTNPTFRDVLRGVRDRWKPFRRGLRREDQARFDDLLEKAGAHADAAGYANPADPTALVLLSVLLEQQAEMDALADRLAAAEDRLARAEGRLSDAGGRLDALEDRLAAVGTDARLAGTEAEARLAALDARLDALEARVPSGGAERDLARDAGDEAACDDDERRPIPDGGRRPGDDATDANAADDRDGRRSRAARDVEAAIDAFWR